jgi:predicted NAD-dependent protein-ADP-ribosyltransferase YbiA (DUF1768 family)
MFIRETDLNTTRSIETPVTEQSYQSSCTMACQSSLSSLKTVSESTTKTCYEHVKGFLSGIWKWLTSWFCCVAFTDPNRAKDIEAISNLAKRGYVLFSGEDAVRSLLETSHPETAFLSLHYPCSITVKGRIFDSAFLAAFGVLLKDETLIDEFSQYKAGDKDKAYARLGAIQKQISKEVGFCERILGMTPRQFSMMGGDALIEEALRLKFETVPGLKERLLATGDCLLVDLKAGKKLLEEGQSEVLMKLREALGGQAASEDAKNAYQKALNAVQGDPVELIK